MRPAKRFPRLRLFNLAIATALQKQQSITPKPPRRIRGLNTSNDTCQQYKSTESTFRTQLRLCAPPNALGASIAPHRQSLGPQLHNTFPTTRTPDNRNNAPPKRTIVRNHHRAKEPSSIRPLRLTSPVTTPALPLKSGAYPPLHLSRSTKHAHNAKPTPISSYLAYRYPVESI